MRRLSFKIQLRTDLEDFKLINQNKTVPYQTLKKFESSIWKNEETLEPLEEMKRFGTNQNK